MKNEMSQLRYERKTFSDEEVSYLKDLMRYHPFWTGQLEVLDKLFDSLPRDNEGGDENV